ncbi:MAG: PilZ domain protein [Syntrophus sp. PtaU1.Bin208]|nr:MAG: PilZ domain protein [Syntrophus sp. PtaU1.Bin208]
MKDKRIYQRYLISSEESEHIQDDIKLNGVPVRLVDFSFGGLCVISDQSYTTGDIVTIFASFANGGRIDLIGKVVRVAPEGTSWSVAVDLAGQYKVTPQRKS